ncbi:hypothetical protein ABPG74_020729 [Tetrahymena malaccensis]
MFQFSLICRLFFYWRELEEDRLVQVDEFANKPFVLLCSSLLWMLFFNWSFFNRHFFTCQGEVSRGNSHSLYEFDSNHLAQNHQDKECRILCIPGLQSSIQILIERKTSLFVYFRQMNSVFKKN